MDAFAFLLREPIRPSTVTSPRDCFAMLASFDDAFPSSIDRAAVGGLVADRLGYAFLAGYRAALFRLDPTLTRASLCATEQGGGHPRAIATRLTPRDDAFRLDGEKTFATLASAASTLLVVAKRPPAPGDDPDRNHLQIARIPADRAGVTIRDREPLAFAPEIPHGHVTFDGVHVARDEVLEGDGYTRVLKPFRTIEDVHVTAAWLGLVVRYARSVDAHESVERALATIGALCDLASRDPSAPETHVALAGILADASAVAASLPLASLDETTRARWERDLPLLGVAKTVRELRRKAAWAAFSR